MHSRSTSALFTLTQYQRLVFPHVERPQVPINESVDQEGAQKDLRKINRSKRVTTACGQNYHQG